MRKSVKYTLTWSSKVILINELTAPDIITVGICFSAKFDWAVAVEELLEKARTR